MRRHTWIWLCAAGLLIALLAGAAILRIPPFVCKASTALKRDAAAPVPTPQAESPRAASDGQRTLSPASQDAIVARVNGQPIYEKDVAFAHPANSFGMDLAAIRQMRLDRLIHSIALRQFLDAHQVAVADDLVEQTLTELKKNPPSAGCACCRYASLDQFMQDNFLTLDELRMMIRNNEGLKQYAEAQWEKAYPEGEKRAQLLLKEREGVEHRYIKAYQIFFNTFQQPDFQTAPDRVIAEARKKADTAIVRLQKGETFQGVARAVSEDVVTKPNGGDLGCIPKDTFGNAFAAAVSDLTPGQYSAPVESPWGVHIILREAVTVDDVSAVLKDDYVNRTIQETVAAIQRDATVERTSPSVVPR